MSRRQWIGHSERCRWREAERAVAGLKRIGAVPSARLAITAILARLTGDRGEADKASATLRLALPDSGGDPYTWAAITVAMALQEWAGVSHESEAVPSLLPASTDLIRTLCARAQSVGGEATDLLCLSLALHARQWIERTDRFTEQYGCPLPAMVGRAAS